MRISRRHCLAMGGKTALGVVAGWSFASLLEAAQKAPNGKPWNILFILSDDQGWNQVGYHGSKYYETPGIDRIAAEGMQFTDAYAAAPICSPTRGSILTGKYPARLHITDFIPGSPYPYAPLRSPQQKSALPLEEETIAEVLKKKGYVTAHIGKWHLSPSYDYAPNRPFDPETQGFDVVFKTKKPEEGDDPAADAHNAVSITRESLKFLEEHKDRPFFLHVSHNVVHRPIMEHPELIAKYEAKPGADQPINNAVMGAMIERMDRGIGQLLDKLDELGLVENTVVIFFSDNGGLEQLQDQSPLRGGKATIFDGGLKVPMAIRWPGVVKPGSRCTIPVISNDFFNTMVEIAGVKPTARHADGESLVPLLKQKGRLNRKAIYWHYPHYHHLGFKPAGAVREGDYKLIEWYEQTLLGLENQINLYNLREDPGETRDLAREMPEKAAALRAKLHAWRKSVKAQEMTVNPQHDPARVHVRQLEET
jgi:arylsulfatase A